MELNASIGAAYAEAAAAAKAGDKAKAEAAMARFRELDGKQNKLIHEDFKLAYAARLKNGAPLDPTTPKLNELIELEGEQATLKAELAKLATDGSPAEKRAQFAEEIAELEERRRELEPEAIYEAVYSTTILGVTRRFPELKDPQSEFSKRMDARIDELGARKDPMLHNPKHPLLIADEIQQQMEKEKGSAK